MKRTQKKITKQIMAAVLSFVMLILPSDVCFAAQEVPLGASYEGNNTEAQNYFNSASTIHSYLSYDGEQTLMKVQAGVQIDGVWVGYYSLSYRKKSALLVPQELPIFGGFHETANNYYLVTGQNNPDESSDVECFRITKYDKNWNRISSVGLYDCNTTVPFMAGSLRMADDGKYLLIRTCHQMYRGSNGTRHQANVTIQVDMEKMEITDSHTRVSYSGEGYVSHSFNQFIGLENNHIIAADHGDAYPRALLLLEYPTDYTTGSFKPGYFDECRRIDMLTIPGRVGENNTGASLGGMELSDTSYLLAGNSVVQDENNLSRNTRNVFVAAYSKADGQVFVNWITNYAEGDGTTSTPQFVKIAPNQYMLLWSRSGEVYYTQIDGDGRQTGEIYHFTGNLSDCVPVVVKDKLVWYVWNNAEILFYQIHLNDFSYDIKNSDETGVGNFVERLYTLVLQRGASDDEIGSWTDALLGKRSNGVDAGYGFVFSDECKEKNISNADFVEILYNTFMNRPSDEGGKTAWVSQLDAGVEREKVFEGFICSVEFAQICAQYGINVGNISDVGALAGAVSHYRNQNANITKFVARCYTEAMGRDYEPDGLEAWCKVIIEKSNTPKQVAQNFIFSDEFTLKNLSDEEYVKVLYRTFMGREADEGGLAAWVGVLESEREDRAKVLEGFSDSVEFDGILRLFGLN